MGHSQQTHWTEGALGVDVQTLAFAAAHVEGQLAGDGQGVTDLRFACTELAEDLGDTASLDTTGEKGVEILGAGGDVDELGASGVNFCSTLESERNNLVSW